MSYDLIRFVFLSGTLYLNLQRFDRAESVYSELIKRNPENTLYYIKYLEVKQSTDADEIVDTFEYFQKQFPRAHAPKRLSLNYATGKPNFLFHQCVFIFNWLTSYLREKNSFSL